jgi:hypothetical protein
MWVLSMDINMIAVRRAEILSTKERCLAYTCVIILLVPLLSISFISCASMPEQTSKPEQTYRFTIEAGEGGTIPAGQADFINGNYKKGAEIRLIARGMPEYSFVNWTSSNGGIFKDEKAPGTTFTMPGNDTVVTGHFELSKQK